MLQLDLLYMYNYVLKWDNCTATQYQDLIIDTDRKYLTPN